VITKDQADVFQQVHDVDGRGIVGSIQVTSLADHRIALASMAMVVVGNDSVISVKRPHNGLVVNIPVDPDVIDRLIAALFP